MTPSADHPLDTGSGGPQARVNTVRELRLQGSREAEDEFAHRRVDLRLTAPDGRVTTHPLFHAGGRSWVARWTPEQAGTWTEEVLSCPHDAALDHDARIEVAPAAAVEDTPGGGTEPGPAPAPRGAARHGMVRATPGRGGGFSFEDGTPAVVLGDTVYNLFGWAHCGLDWEGFLERRAEQGFTLLRARLAVSPFHVETAHSRWQTRSCFPWQGSEQRPLFDRFHHEWFESVDRVVQRCGELGLGLELIMEGWGFEFPWNDRARFTAEHELLWIRYLLARYDAYPQVWLWTPFNEYEQYPDGHMEHNLAADLWLQRIGRTIKDTARHGHPVACHNGPPDPAFATRWTRDPEAIDAVMFQHWGTFDAQHGWLAEGLEEQMEASFAGYTGSRVLAEWGYERNPSFDLDVPWHEAMGIEHTRRGAWRAVFAAMGWIHGFESTWGPWALLHEDQSGMEDLLAVRIALTELLPWTRMAPVKDPAGTLDLEHTPPDLPTSRPDRAGLALRALATADARTVALYLPAGGALTLGSRWAEHRSEWIDPRTAAVHPAQADQDRRLAPPRSVDRDSRSQVPGDGGHPQDWILRLHAE